eukprot:11582515-Alexandrium_andersonii.AAC.1
MRLANVTVGELQQLAEIGAQKKSTAIQVYFEGVHSQSGSPIVVKDRNDRVPLISMYEDGGQILQCRKDCLESEAK